MVVAFGLPLAYGGRTLWPVNHVAASVSDLDPRRVGESRPAGPHRIPAGGEPCATEQLGAERLRFTDAQRRRLAAKAKKIGRKGLFEISTLVHRPRVFLDT